MYEISPYKEVQLTLHFRGGTKLCTTPMSYFPTWSLRDFLNLCDGPKLHAYYQQPIPFIWYHCSNHQREKRHITSSLELSPMSNFSDLQSNLAWNKSLPLKGLDKGNMS